MCLHTKAEWNAALEWQFRKRVSGKNINATKTYNKYILCILINRRGIQSRALSDGIKNASKSRNEKKPEKTTATATAMTKNYEKCMTFCGCPRIQWHFGCSTLAKKWAVWVKWTEHKKPGKCWSRVHKLNRFFLHLPLPLLRRILLLSLCTCREIHPCFAVPIDSPHAITPMEHSVAKKTKFKSFIIVSMHILAVADGRRAAFININIFMIDGVSLIPNICIAHQPLFAQLQINIWFIWNLFVMFRNFSLHI